MKNIELRCNEIEFRATEDGSMLVSGYVNETGQLSNVLGITKRFREKINPGVFERAITQKKHDIDFLAEHDRSKILSSTRNSSLNLIEDDKGLFMEAMITPTSYGKDYYELIKSGIMRNMSFGFRTLKDSWRNSGDGVFERTIEDMELFEVSVVRDPAYSQSSIAARGINVVEDIKIPEELEQEERDLEELKEAFKSLEQKFESLLTEVREMRSEIQPVEPVVEPVVEESATEPIIEDQPVESIESEQESEQVDEIVDPVVETETEEVKEDQRSEDKSAYLIELRSKLEKLKK